MLSPEEISALYLSAKVGLFATLVNLPFAIAVAWILARYEFRFKVFLESLLQLPMILPPVVLGYFLLILFGNRGVIGQFLTEWGIQFAFNWKGAVIASMVVAFPLMVQPIRLSFQLINRQLEQVAQTLGASPIQAFWSISLPLAVPGILIGSILCFSRSLGEFGATITFVGNIPDETRTVPIAIYSLLQQPDGESMAMRLVMLSVLLAFAALVANHIILQRYQQRLTS
ncbi:MULTISPECIES: molybdate ABC transporter permease subunit [Acinetobacter]|uniref:Molybdenum transport system permease n=1 Tax=Acinetobacter baylyi (strain ATCC 33305 / BD413 / ADP1) TaxID=62977 RepID=Q6FB35_ACIAD|nr:MULTISPECIES: molybdate ABC transporter permease subunit [Acinetobacter]ENV53663.1 molybdate ABC transporter, permease [Acinetobacter baylyi DSM 14961 = CIP 107474]KAF2373355.1 molybdate ABC transporter permease [Acinetobacter baylyi]KAF2374229.1 molybdate ABC transporter permease [Acinetobacter baylyi]KAF2378873.1 molybdate ABC transporter permease [Acinetobacter baylyi]KAF2381187.1 molybdate ABC transporter permease [Acinetobacter baylyi]